MSLSRGTTSAQPSDVNAPLQRNTHRRDARRAAALIVTAALCATCKDDAAPPRETPRLYACPGCARPDQAPVPDGAGGVRCIDVGASSEATPDDPRALLPSLPTPLRYVDASAAPGGDGTRERPFATLRDALATGTSGALVLRAGRYTLDAPLTLQGSVALVGAGTSTTFITPIASGAALAITGSTTDATVARVTFAAPPGGAPTAAAIEVRDGARAALRDVSVQRPFVGLRAMGARVTARGVTIESSLDDCVRVDDGASAALTATRLRGCGRDGVRAAGDVDGGRLHLTSSLIDSAHGYGVALAGTGGEASGFDDCAAADPWASRGARDCLRDVSVQRVEGVGVGVAGARTLSATRLQVSCTLAGPRADVGSGYGLYATLGADVHLDDAPGFEGPSALGRGSQLIANARAGAVIERQPAGATPASRDTLLTSRGALVASNEGPGIVLQNGARGAEVSYAQVLDNAGLGLALTRGTSIAAVLCDQFISTRMTIIETTEGPLRVGDGLSIYAASAARVDDNVLSRNERFGAVLGDATARLSNNRGDDNLYGVGNYGPRAVTLDPSNRVVGRAPAPATASIVAATR